MQAAETWLRDQHGARARLLDLSVRRCRLAERQMSAVIVVVRNVCRREPPEVFGVEHDDVVQELAAHGAYESLGVPLHPGFAPELVELDANIELPEADIQCRERLGGMLKFYYRDAA